MKILLSIIQRKLISKQVGSPDHTASLGADFSGTVLFAQDIMVLALKW